MEQQELFPVTKEISNTENVFIVQKSKELIQQAKHTLSAKELTLLDFMVSQVEQSDNDLFVVNTTIAEINSICNFGNGGAADKSTEKALLQLSNKGFWLVTDNGYKTIGRWLGKAYIKAGKATLQLDKDLAPYLLNLESGSYTRFYFRDVVNLKSIYSKSLYELLRSYDHLSEVILSVEKIAEIFNKQDLAWYRLLNYLRRAVRDISEKTTMSVEYETIKEGRETTAVKFLIQRIEGELINEKL